MSAPIRALIADDEKPARDRLRAALAECARLSVVGEAVNGAHTVELVRELKPHLLFLDVQMPVLNGFEVLQQLKVRPTVIFTTAYDEYALRAFEVHAIDYLLKPYTKDRLHDAVKHALSAMDVIDRRTAGLVADFGSKRPYLTRLTIKQGRTYRVMPLDHVDYFRADGGLVFWVQENQRYLVDYTLTELEERLDPAQFMRVHRNTIANMRRITRVVALGRGRLAAEFASNERIDVGRSRLDDFRAAMISNR